VSTYPIELFSQASPEEVNWTINSKSKAGRSETYFDYKLDKYFRGFIRRSVNIGRFKPDYIFCDAGRKIYIDIEIDEPYVLIKNIPIHYKGYDDKRNSYFLSKGWDVIRFTEEQVANYPNACCKFISTHIYHRCGEHIWIDGFAMTPDLEEVEHHSEEDSIQLAAKGFRWGYSKNLKLNLIKQYTFSIVIDTIFLTKYFAKTFSFYKHAPHVKSNILHHANLSIFLNELIRYKYLFDPIVKKVTVEVLFFISNYHSFQDFTMAEDIVDENIQLDTFYIRTDNILCFEIGDYIVDRNKKNVILVADDPAYPLIVTDWLNKGIKVILARQEHDTFMPGKISHINLSKASGLAIGLKDYEI
jgi:very-short-patch-repair endonuclease